jgi:hypothetical protein
VRRPYTTKTRNVPEGVLGDRFFAQVRSAIVECPKCGAVYYLSAKGGTGGGGGRVPVHKIRRRKEKVWDPITQRFRCQCGAAYVLGIVAWSLAMGCRSTGVPVDAILTPRDRLRMRHLTGGGVWVDQGNDTNQGGRRTLRLPVNVVKEEM